MGGVVSPHRVDGFRFCCGAGAWLDCFFSYCPVLAHCLVFRPLGRDSFLCVAKEKGPKERPPYCVGLRRFCALQLTAGAAELAALRQSSRYSALSFQCSTTQKGFKDQKTGQNRFGGA